MGTAIRFEKVSKRFTLFHDRPQSLQEMMIRVLHPRRPHSNREDFWAVRDASFEIEQGTTVGLIGTNGSGKSTALKMMAGILQPTEGRVVVSGRISALLELGSGMHPELTGRENVFLNGSMLGLTNAEMRRLYPKIVEFSELGRFIDMPVKHYSSGMYMRLGFSVAVFVQPDILLLDEVLAVGDQSFQTKCLDHIYEMKKRGTTIVMVSHGIETMTQMCNQLVWLQNGVLRAQGNTAEVADAYLRSVHATMVHAASVVDPETPLELDGADEAGELQEGLVESEPRFQRWGTREVELTDVRLRNGSGQVTTAFLTGDTLVVEMDYLAREPVRDPMFGIAITRVDGTHINGPNNKFGGLPIPMIEGRGTVTYTIPNLPLMKGSYEITAVAYDGTGAHAFDVHDKAYNFQVNAGGTREMYGLFAIPAEWNHHSAGTPSAIVALGQEAALANAPR
jgi:lipopolysaccharide transport system ATP-binding protein